MITETTEAATAEATRLKVTDTAAFCEGSIFQADGSREIIRVADVDADGYNVERGQFNTCAEPVPAGTVLRLVGGARPS